MRVLLDTTYTLRGPSGTGVYIEQLAAALRAQGVDVVEAANRRRPDPSGGGAGSARNLALDQSWTQVALPRHAARAGADVIHHPLPALAVRAPCPQVVTLHDLAFERLPEHFAPGFRRWASVSHRRAARGADAVVCVSQTTRLDALARWGLVPQRIVVAPHGPGQLPAGSGDGATREADPDAAASPPRTGGQFLYVGDDEPRKNLGLLLDAYARYRQESWPRARGLVLAGKAHSAAEGVRWEPRPDLAALLGSAVALVHPALHEGFGLTALEAMNAGLPVIAARSPGLVETCGDAALYIDPYAGPEPLARALRKVASDPALREDLSRRGRERAAAFSWEASARAHIAAYELAAAHDGRPG